MSRKNYWQMVVWAIFFGLRIGAGNGVYTIYCVLGATDTPYEVLMNSMRGEIFYLQEQLSPQTVLRMTQIGKFSVYHSSLRVFPSGSTLLRRTETVSPGEAFIDGLYDITASNRKSPRRIWVRLGPLSMTNPVKR